MSCRPPLLRRLTYPRLVAVDVLFSGVLVVFGHPADGAWNGLPEQLLYVLIAVSACSVAIRRPWPLVALGVSLACFLGLALYGYFKFAAVPLELALYLVAVARPRRVAVGGLIVTELLMAFGFAFGESGGPHTPLPLGADWRGLWFGQSAVMLAFWATGFMLRARREYERGLHAQAERRAQARIDEALRTVTQERMRIARELHDVVAHSMSVIAVQAGVGHHVIGVRPDEAAKALAAIETTSRAALREMRALLGVLREETPEEEAEDLLAAPGLADLALLAERTGRAGLRVELRFTGEPWELPPAMDLAGYRIAQEALTNVVKHAGTDQARVQVVYGRGEVEIEVTDDGVGPGAAVMTGGHGLVGMRERVALYGGEFAAGPRPVGGFRVWARLADRDDAA
ncbi:MAG TPA: sensor histidine kinase [Actinocrinis sp.]|nr:sensor histidine kinase [Actinocrinis sp.]